MCMSYNVIKTHIWSCVCCHQRHLQYTHMTSNVITWLCDAHMQVYMLCSICSHQGVTADGCGMRCVPSVKTDTPTTWTYLLRYTPRSRSQHHSTWNRTRRCPPTLITSQEQSPSREKMWPCPMNHHTIIQLSSLSGRKREKETEREKARHKERQKDSP